MFIQNDWDIFLQSFQHHKLSARVHSMTLFPSSLTSNWCIDAIHHEGKIFQTLSQCFSWMSSFFLLDVKARQVYFLNFTVCVWMISLSLSSLMDSSVFCYAWFPLRAIGNSEWMDLAYVKGLSPRLVLCRRFISSGN